MTRLNGNVTPMLDMSASDPFARGIATETAAGAAMYDALAESVAKIATPPSDRPLKSPTKAPKKPAKIGKITAKMIIFEPTSRI